jgi:RNA polymerase sigma-70 factor (ECF subfamily)
MAASEVADPDRGAADALESGVRRVSIPPFDQIYHEYFDFVWRCTRSFGVPEEAMDDVVQEIFIVVQKRLHTLEKGQALRSWIYGIVRRSVSTSRRSRRTRDAHSAAEAASAAASGPSPLEAAEQAERLRILSVVLERLDKAKREVFVLAEIAELSVPEIADTLGIPVNTAYSRLRAARQAFDAALTRHLTLLEKKGR